MDGTCIDLFNGCDESSDFVFFDPLDAEEASNALIAQVFDRERDTVDTDPTFTLGITYLEVGIMFTPFEVIGDSVNGHCALNLDGRLPDYVAPCAATTTSDFTIFSDATYAVWTPVSAVPIPAAIWLFGTAMIGLVGFGKRKSLTA